MANTNWVTNRGAKSYGTTAVHSATNFFMGLLWADSGTVPAAIDTLAEVADLNTVTELLAATGVIEVVGGSYARQGLTSVALTEDDTNDRANLDSANATFSAVPASGSKQVYGAFLSRGTGVNGDDLVQVAIFASTLTPNGSDITVTVADFCRFVPV